MSVFFSHSLSLSLFPSLSLPYLFAFPSLTRNFSSSLPHSISPSLSFSLPLSLSPSLSFSLSLFSRTQIAVMRDHEAGSVAAAQTMV